MDRIELKQKICKVIDDNLKDVGVITEDEKEALACLKNFIPELQYEIENVMEWAATNKSSGFTVNSIEMEGYLRGLIMAKTMIEEFDIAKNIFEREEG